SESRFSTSVLPSLQLELALPCSLCVFLFFFNDTATTEIYTLSLHDALPISAPSGSTTWWRRRPAARSCGPARSEEHTSELQSHLNLVCRLLLEKKKTTEEKPLEKTYTHLRKNTTLHKRDV